MRTGCSSVYPYLPTHCILDSSLDALQLSEQYRSACFLMPANNVPNIDRPDVHRSAKALEQIIALFHDYCQAIGACVSIQKKMSRAMKEAANVKGTHATASQSTRSMLFPCLLYEC